MLVIINVKGCDDETTLELDVTEQELDFLRQLAAQITEASSYSCQPKMAVVKKELDATPNN